jgi:predicted RNA-binding protein with PUA-like domain
MATTPKNYWLIKSEPTCYSIDDFQKDGKTLWTGIRNYQARNFMRDQMQIGDLALFYHSSANPMAVVGIAKVVSKPMPDTTAFDTKDDHFDPKATKENPIWYAVEFQYVKKLKNPVTLDQIKFAPSLKGVVQGSQFSQ